MKTWNVLRHLCQQSHQVTLVTFIRAEEVGNLEKVRELVEDVHTVSIIRSRAKDLLDLLRSTVMGIPFLIARDNQTAMRDTIIRLARNGGYDVVHADQLTMAQFALLYRSTFQSQESKNRSIEEPESGSLPRIVFDSHNATWLILQRSRQFSPAWVRPWLSIESKKTRRYEGQLVQDFDLTLTVSDEDRLALLEAAGSANAQAPEKIVTIPIAVDCESLQPVKRQAGYQITTMGTLYYPPNADGIRWFAREVFPIIQQEIPETTFAIVGKRPPADFVEMANERPDLIRVLGYLPDLTPYLEKTSVMVVPVRTGGGMRVRILESLARGIPVVTTSLGAEGIQVTPGEDILVEDTSSGFARAVIDLLRSSEKQAALVENGRRLVERLYDWKVVLPKMDASYPGSERNPA